MIFIKLRRSGIIFIHSPPQFLFLHPSTRKVGKPIGLFGFLNLLCGGTDTRRRQVLACVMAGATWQMRSIHEHH
jgi:hypothetical protein